MSFLKVSLATSILLGAGCANLPKNYGKIDNNFSRSGQPSLEEMSALTNMGVKTILRLNGGTGDKNRRNYEDETGFCTSNKINLINIPISVHGYPSRENLLEIISTIENPTNYPLHVHCGAGADRTGFATFIYLLSNDFDPSTAKKEGMSRKYGHKEFYPMDHLAIRYKLNTAKDPKSFKEWIGQTYFTQYSSPDTYEYKCWKRSFEESKRFWQLWREVP